MRSKGAYPDGSLFASKDCEGLKSAPEYGIGVKRKKNLEAMEKYKAENVPAVMTRGRVEVCGGNYGL